MTLEEALKENDLNDIFDRMLLYATVRLKDVPLKDLNGKEAYDFVSEVFLKVLEGKRNWDTAKCTFNEFLFGSLRSHISNFFEAGTIIYDIDISQIKLIGTTNNNISESIKKATNILIANGADEMEILVFECWVENILKSAEIAKFLEIDVKEVYVIVKRLSRKITLLKTQLSAIV